MMQQAKRKSDRILKEKKKEKKSWYHCINKNMGKKLSKKKNIYIYIYMEKNNRKVYINNSVFVSI